MASKMRQPPRGYADLTNKEKADIDRTIQANATERIKCASPELIKRGVLHMLDQFPFVVWNIVGSLDAVEQEGVSKDDELARRLLPLAYPTDEAREDAANATWQEGSVLDSLVDIGSECDVSVIHPDILPHALPVLIREARIYLTVVRKEQPKAGGAIASCLRKLERAAKKGGATDAK